MQSKEEICLEAIRSGRISIDNEGCIWKFWRQCSNARKEYNPPRRADHADKLGYCRVNLYVGGRQLIVYAHRLVWVHSNGRIPDGKEINHIDGNKSNNRLSNLELVTKSQNQRHAIDVTKTHKTRRGESNVLAKMNWANVDEMRRRRREEKPTPTYSELGKDFGVSNIIARAICLELRWKPKHRPPGK